MEDDVLNQLLDEIPNMTEAIRCCIRVARLTDKQVYLELGIDAGHWSRMIKNQAYFPHDRLLELMNICGNDVPLQWLANQRGYELRLAQSSFEEILAKERKEKEEVERKLDFLIDVLKKAKLPIS